MKMRDGLIELLIKCEYISDLDAEYDCCAIYELVADYLLANGVIVLPIKVGDVVYTNINGTTLQNSFMVNKVDLLGFSNGLYSWTWHQLGKSVFLTLEDAQKALEGDNNG